MLDFRRMRQIPLRLWAIAVLSGILQVLPFPIAGPTPLWRTAFCWIALLPLLWALLANNKTGNPLTVFQGTLLGYACGITWYLGNCYWIFQTMYLYGGLPKPVAAGILILFCLYLGLYHALFGTLVSTFHRRFGRQTALLLVPFAWVAVELARARITGLPWDILGVAQVDNPLLTRLAPITGAYGLSFIIAAVNALFLIRIRIRDRPHTRPTLTLGGVAIIVLYIAGLRLIATPKPDSHHRHSYSRSGEHRSRSRQHRPATHDSAIPRLVLLSQPLSIPNISARHPRTRGHTFNPSHPPALCRRIKRPKRPHRNSHRPHRLARISSAIL